MLEWLYGPLCSGNTSHRYTASIIDGRCMIFSWFSPHVHAVGRAEQAGEHARVSLSAVRSAFKNVLGREHLASNGIYLIPKVHPFFFFFLFFFIPACIPVTAKHSPAVRRYGSALPGIASPPPPFFSVIRHAIDLLTNARLEQTVVIVLRRILWDS